MWVAIRRLLAAAVCGAAVLYYIITRSLAVGAHAGLCFIAVA